MFQFVPKVTETVHDLLAKAKPRKEPVVLAMEDLFYCAHNAATSPGVSRRSPVSTTPPRVPGGTRANQHAELGLRSQSDVRLI